MPETSSCPSWDCWKQYAEDTLPPAEQAELSAHLDGCADCCRTLDRVAAGGDALLAEAREVGRQQPAPAPAAAAGAGLEFLAPPGKHGSLGRLGHYEILAVIGRGGMGLVLKAFDETLHRVVAIKVLAPELAGNSSARTRFLREARAAAAIRHEHIIGIHAVGDQPLPHLVMEYVAGQTLQQKLDRVGPLQLNEVLRLGYQIASGLANAHAQGLIHRDIKPSNILLENSVERAKLSDFGLARAVDDASVTQSGVIAGTPHYMSPEQAEGGALDQRSDLFSLGSVLYVMCTGRLPFRAGTTLAVLKRVHEDTPRPVREICGEIPDWLAAIIGKLHAKKPYERFQSAQEVADLLGHYLAELQLHGAVQPPISAVALTHTSPKRKRGSAASLTLRASVASAVGVTAALLLWLNWSSRTTHHAPLTSQRDEKPGQPTPHRLLSLEELRRQPSPLDQWKRQDIAPVWLALAGGGDPAQAPPELVAILGDDQSLAPVLAVAVSPDGRTLAAAGKEHAVRLWDLADGKPTRLLTRHTDAVSALVFSPDGTLLASASADGTIVLWDVAMGKEVRTLTWHSRNGSLLAFSPDGQTLAAGGEDASVKLWDVATGKPKEPLRWHTGAVRAVAYSPDGTLLASGGQDRTVQVWEADTGRRRHTFQTASAVTNLAFADSNTLAVTGEMPDEYLHLWDLATRKETVSPFHAAGVLSMACQPGGRLAATGSADGTVRFWDVTAAPLRSLFVPRGPCGAKVQALAFTPEGRYLATANDNGTVTILRVPAPPGPYELGPAQQLKEPVELANERNPADALRHQDIPPELLAKAAFSSGDQAKAPAQLVAVLSAAELTTQVTTVAFSPDGKTLAWAGADCIVVLWDLAKGKLHATLAGGHDKTINSVAFSPDGKTLASAGEDRLIRIWDVVSARSVRTLTGHGQTISQLAFSPDGRWLASTSRDATVRMWSAATWTLERTFLGLASTNAVVFSADSKYLFAESAGTRVPLWDAGSGWELTSLPEHRSHVGCLALHPGGRLLLAATGGYGINLWNLDTLQAQRIPIADLRGAWRADGGLLATVGATDGALRLWDLSAAPPRRVALPLFRAGAHSLRDVAFSPEGRYLATANHDGTVYLLKLAGPGEVYHLSAD